MNEILIAATSWPDAMKNIVGYIMIGLIVIFFIKNL